MASLQLAFLGPHLRCSSQPPLALVARESDVQGCCAADVQAIHGSALVRVADLPGRTNYLGFCFAEFVKISHVAGRESLDSWSSCTASDVTRFSAVNIWNSFTFACRQVQGRFQGRARGPWSHISGLAPHCPSPNHFFQYNWVLGIKKVAIYVIFM